MTTRIWTSVLVLSASLAAGCGDSNNGNDMGSVVGDMAVKLGGDLATKAGDMATAGNDGGGMAKVFQVTLTKAAEPTACATAGATATGSATVTIDAAGSSIAVTNFTFTGLSGAATMAHIHSGAAGTNGNVVLNFGATPTSPVNKTFTAADYPATPPAGAPANFAAFVTAMKAGQSYINVHTSNCGGGEIRGQIQ